MLGPAWKGHRPPSTIDLDGQGEIGQSEGEFQTLKIFQISFCVGQGYSSGVPLAFCLARNLRFRDPKIEQLDW